MSDSPHTSAVRRIVPHTLGDEEEAWYHHEPDSIAVASIHQWIRMRPLIVIHTANHLAEDEDAWARP